MLGDGSIPTTFLVTFFYESFVFLAKTAKATITKLQTNVITNAGLGKKIYVANNRCITVITIASLGAHVLCFLSPHSTAKKLLLRLPPQSPPNNLTDRNPMGFGKHPNNHRQHV
jgi:hypothetical protein